MSNPVIKITSLDDFNCQEHFELEANPSIVKYYQREAPASCLGVSPFLYQREDITPVSGDMKFWNIGTKGLSLPHTNIFVLTRTGDGNYSTNDPHLHFASTTVNLDNHRFDILPMHLIS